MLNLNTLCPGIWIYSAPGDDGQIVYFPKMHCFFGPQKMPGPKIFGPPGHSTKRLFQSQGRMSGEDRKTGGLVGWPVAQKRPIKEI